VAVATQLSVGLSGLIGPTIKAKEHQRVEVALDDAFAAQLVFSAFDAAPGVAARAHPLEGRTIFFGHITQAGGRNLSRFVFVHVEKIAATVSDELWLSIISIV